LRLEQGTKQFEAARIYQVEISRRLVRAGLHQNGNDFVVVRGQSMTIFKCSRRDDWDLRNPTDEGDGLRLVWEGSKHSKIP